MNNFMDLLNEPLASRKGELIEYVYESSEKSSEDTADISIIGFYDDIYLPEYISEDILIKNLDMKGRIKTVIVELRTNEGWEKPHVHVRNEYVNIAVRLDVPEYFIHPHAKDTFNNNKQKEIFDEFMRKTTPIGDETYWEYCKRVFNMINIPEGHPLKTKEQPDYTKLP